MQPVKLNDQRSPLSLVARTLGCRFQESQGNLTQANCYREIPGATLGGGIQSHRQEVQVIKTSKN